MASNTKRRLIQSVGGSTNSVSFSNMAAIVPHAQRATSKPRNADRRSGCFAQKASSGIFGNGRRRRWTMAFRSSTSAWKLCRGSAPWSKVLCRTIGRSDHWRSSIPWKPNGRPCGILNGVSAVKPNHSPISLMPASATMTQAPIVRAGRSSARSRRASCRRRRAPSCPSDTPASPRALPARAPWPATDGCVGRSLRWRGRAL